MAKVISRQRSSIPTKPWRGAIPIFLDADEVGVGQGSGGMRFGAPGDLSPSEDWPADTPSCDSSSSQPQA